MHHLKVRGREVAKARATRFPPPMWGRDREGGGDGAPRANLLQRADSRNQELEPLLPGIELKTTAVLVVPPSLSLPHMGGGNAVAPLFHTSHAAFAFVSKHVCMR